MPEPSNRISSIDHVALPFRDVKAASEYYERVLGARTVNDHVAGGRILVRQVMIGGALFNMHQYGNGVDLVAGAPTVGSLDICLRWDGPIESAVALLRDKGVDIVDGPSPRKYSDGRPSTSVYFRDLDGNLVELMAPAG